MRISNPLVGRSLQVPPRNSSSMPLSALLPALQLGGRGGPKSIKVNAELRVSCPAVADLANCSLKLFGTTAMGVASNSYAPLLQVLGLTGEGRGKSRWSNVSGSPEASRQFASGM